jgi:hypothetical protein
MSHAVQAPQHPGANGSVHHTQSTHGAEQNDHEHTDKSGGHNDSMLQIANIFMSKTASIAFLELQGANGRKFHFNENIMKQILLPDHSTQNQNTANYASNLLKRIHLQKIFIQPGTNNGFPFPLGLRIHGIVPNEYSITGEAWNYILPQKCSIQLPVCIFESRGDESLMATWEEDFAKWNSENLETLCAMSVPDTDIVMVHLEHPVVQLLDKKFLEFGTVAPSAQLTNTPNWRQIPRNAFGKACQWLRDNILSKSSKTFDLSQLTLHISKIDGSKFTDLTAGCFSDMKILGTENVQDMNEKKETFANIVVQMPFTIDIKLALHYRLSMNSQIMY